MFSDLQDKCAFRLLVSFNRCLYTNMNTLFDQSSDTPITSQNVVVEKKEYRTLFDMHADRVPTGSAYLYKIVTI